MNKLNMTLTVFIMSLLSVGAFASVNLDAAYKREYIFLMSQVKELKKQKVELEKKFEQAKKQAMAQLEKNQEKVVSLNAYNEKLGERLFKLEQNAEMGEENKVFLENTLKQAALSLGMKELPKDAKLTELFDQALVKLNDSSKVHNEKGNFFLANGEQTKGDILRLGKIASFGHANGSYYMLAPAGKGELKVWKDAPAGADIFKGQYPATFPIFIYEGLDRSAKKKKSQTVLEFVQAGGSIAWVIVGMGVVAMLLCLIRGISLKRYSNDTSKIEDLCKVEDLDGTKESLTNYETSFGQKNLMLKILNFTSADKEVLNDVIDEGMIHEHKLIDRFGAMILVFAAVAPLMGLLGTVTGMISTFDIITEHGTGDPKLLSQGISEALITTELGLIVAIPTLLFGNMLSGWGKNIKMTMDKLVLRLTNEVCKP